MRADYGYFGDVVVFDTTYRKNNEGRPIPLFVGVNHHRQTVIFGAALLYDETALTFEWLFETFTSAMLDKRPTTILTDQDAAMAMALASKWPQTYHMLCIWHIYQNAAIHLGGVFEEFREFARDFSTCIYDYEDAKDFIDGWKRMLAKYGLEDNPWLMRLFGLKEKWALAYGRHVFCADMTTTHRSESMNGVLKKYLSYKHKFLEFFHHFHRLLEDRRYAESVANWKTITSVPSLSHHPVEILRHACSIYTPETFHIFQRQWFLSHDSVLEIMEQAPGRVVYKIIPPDKNYHHTITGDIDAEKIECSCRKYEFSGILCAHILKIFTTKNVKKISDGFILKRWIRTARQGYGRVTESVVTELVVGEDPTIARGRRYKKLARMAECLTNKRAERDDICQYIEGAFEILMKEADERLQQAATSQTYESFRGGAGELQRVAGVKAKNKTKSGKRLKRDLEKTHRKRRASANTGQPAPVQQPVSYPSSTDVHTPLSFFDSLMIDGTIFTQLLSSQLSQAGSTSCGIDEINFQ